MVTEKCRGCLYFGHRTKTCDYMLLTGQRRGCPTEACTRRVEAEEAKCLVDCYLGKREMSERERAFLSLYEAGHTDAEIARLTGKGRMLVSHWRAKMGLPSQREIEVSSRDG